MHDLLLVMITEKRHRPTYADACIHNSFIRMTLLAKLQERPLPVLSSYTPNTVTATLGAIYILYHEKTQPNVPLCNIKGRATYTWEFFPVPFAILSTSFYLTLTKPCTVGRHVS
jgi:hypothetical protein